MEGRDADRFTSPARARERAQPVDGDVFMTTWTLETLRARRDAILAIAARWGAHRVRVFGSVARGESRPDSDVDFLVEFDRGRSLLDHGGLLADLSDLLCCKVDVVSARGLRERFLRRVEAEAVLL